MNEVSLCRHRDRNVVRRSRAGVNSVILGLQANQMKLRGKMRLFLGIVGAAIALTSVSAAEVANS
jgi:hypothetical protein